MHSRGHQLVPKAKHVDSARRVYVKVGIAFGMPPEHAGVSEQKFTQRSHAHNSKAASRDLAFGTAGGFRAINAIFPVSS